MQLSERRNEAKTPNKAVKTDGAAPRPLPLPPRNSYAMISAFVRCLSLGATQSARLADLDTYRAPVSLPQMPHLWTIIVERGMSPGRRGTEHLDGGNRRPSERTALSRRQK